MPGCQTVALFEERFSSSQKPGISMVVSRPRIGQANPTDYRLFTLSVWKRLRDYFD